MLTSSSSIPTHIGKSHAASRLVTEAEAISKGRRADTGEIPAHMIGATFYHVGLIVGVGERVGVGCASASCRRRSIAGFGSSHCARLRPSSCAGCLTTGRRASSVRKCEVNIRVCVSRCDLVLEICHIVNKRPFPPEHRNSQQVPGPEPPT